MHRGRPERPAFFCVKYGQFLQTARGRGELGAYGLLLLRVIAELWDAQHYCGPIREQADVLAARCGMSERELKRVRARLCELGWLSYEPGARGRCGAYRPEIPPSEGAIPAWAKPIQSPASGGNECQIECQSVPQSPASGGNECQIECQSVPQSGTHFGGIGGGNRGGASHPCISSDLVPKTDRPTNPAGRSVPSVPSQPTNEPNPEPFDPLRQEQADVSAFLERWNASGLRRIERLTATQRGWLLAALSDPDWREHYPAALQRVREIPFLRSGSGRRKGPLDVMEFLRDLDLARQIIDGNFDPRPAPPVNGFTGGHARDSPARPTAGDYARQRAAERAARAV
jgi:hypothetical protein